MFFSRALGLASGFCLLATTAQASGSRIESVSLSRRFPASEGESTRVFKPGDHTLHAIVRLGGVGPGGSGKDLVKAAWVMQSAGGVTNYRFGEKTLGTSGRLDTLHFATSVKRDWPRGKYRLDLYWNGKRVRQEYFEVR